MKTFNHESLAIKITSLAKDIFGGKVQFPLFLVPGQFYVQYRHLTNLNIICLVHKNVKNQGVNINGFLSNQDKLQSICELKVMQLPPKKISQGLKWFFKRCIKNSKLEIAI